MSFRRCTTSRSLRVARTVPFPTRSQVGRVFVRRATPSSKCWRCCRPIARAQACPLVIIKPDAIKTFSDSSWADRTLTKQAPRISGLDGASAHACRPWARDVSRHSPDSQGRGAILATFWPPWQEGSPATASQGGESHGYLALRCWNLVICLHQDESLPS